MAWHPKFVYTCKKSEILIELFIFKCISKPKPVHRLGAIQDSKFQIIFPATLNESHLQSETWCSWTRPPQNPEAQHSKAMTSAATCFASQQTELQLRFIAAVLGDLIPRHLALSSVAFLEDVLLAKHIKPRHTNCSIYAASFFFPFLFMCFLKGVMYKREADRACLLGTSTFSAAL